MKEQRIAVSFKEPFPDPLAGRLQRAASGFFHLDVSGVLVKKVYTILSEVTPEEAKRIAEGPLADAVTEKAELNPPPEPGFDWAVEVGLKAGVTDNCGRTAQLAIEDFIGKKLAPHQAVRFSTQYLFKGSLSEEQVKKLAFELLANPVIETVRLCRGRGVESISLDLSDAELLELSRSRCLALSLEELQTIKRHYQKSEVQKEREEFGLPSCPTDLELEALAQTWSEHCKHKIFNAKIRYEGEVIDSLFKSCIRKATEELREKCPWLVSVFTDNAGIIRFTDRFNLAFKVETHNSPSALDPYGGALTGILGVNRDILGAGRGARLLANTDIFCFAPPDHSEPLPKGLLHPKRVFEGVRLGVEHGGNKSGVPTVNGAILFDKRYLGKPLVYCGTVGIMPAKVGGVATHLKEILPGDRIVVAGGRTGKDGIHGATFSSLELDEASPTSAVQIGDPFTQKKLQDFLLEARDAELYRTLTDNGAGGFSSSVGEMAELSGGCELHLDRAPLKSEELRPWEILVSESQERMTLAVPEEKLEALFALAERHEVELAAIGEFTESGKFHLLFKGETVALLDLKFLHGGVPQMELEARFEPKRQKEFKLPPLDCKEALQKVLASYNVCSKEAVVRQYDHEVQGGSALKPMTGKENDGPSDAALVRPIECMEEGVAVVVACGICPKFSDWDCYWMAASAIDEALRNVVAVGGDPASVAILDNFCWPDPVGDPQKTAQLVRANRALYDFATAFETPIISGKDSMKNDFRSGEVKISVPPTLLISAIGKMEDVEKAVSMDVKAAGDLVYAVGLTRKELGGSELALAYGIEGGAAPIVAAAEAKAGFSALHSAIVEELVASCHDCSDGGLAAALAESAFAGGLGMELELEKLPCEGELSVIEKLFSESNSRFVVTVAPEQKGRFEKVMEKSVYGCIGRVVEEGRFVVKGVLEAELAELKEAWQGGLL